MKKFGFTMAEVLIALGIVGIGAALIAPAVIDMMPDKNKMKVLNYHARIADITEQLLDTDWIYFDPNQDVAGAANCEGLECTQTPAMAPYNSGQYSGANKYPNLLRNKLGIEGNEFTDGSSWTINGAGNGGYRIVINVDGDGAESRSFAGANSRKVNTFEFEVDKFGAVSGVDPLTRAYLSNPLKTNCKKEDYERAAGL